jgi:hypothetical protein
MWHVSHDAATFCFTLPLPRVTAPDPSTVKFATRDESTKNYFVAKDHTIAMFSVTGTLLKIVDLCAIDLLSGPASKLPATASRGAIASVFSSSETLREKVTAVAYLNVPTHSLVNVLLCGHENGSLSFWCVETVSNPAEHETHKITFHSTVVVDKSQQITSIVVLPESLSVLLGTDSGAVIFLGIPPLESDPSDA